jgi:hypothetical protein
MSTWLVRPVVVVVEAVRIDGKAVATSLRATAAQRSDRSRAYLGRVRVSRVDGDVVVAV